MSRQVTILSAFVCLFGSFLFLTRSSSPLTLPSISSEKRPFSLTAFHQHVPYTSSWAGWWNPRGVKGTFIAKDWNLLYHLGGNGPWIEKRDGVVQGGVGAPSGCSIEQVHMMSRHAERFPTIKAGGRMIDLLNRIRNLNVTLLGDLSFVNDWEYFTQAPEKHFEQLTTTGPYAGTLEAFTTGVKLRTRYSHLLNESLDAKTTLWAGDSARVIDTARYFSAGFFGIDWQKLANLVVIPETDDLGGDTLTPGDTCIKYHEDPIHGHEYGANMLAKFQSTYLGAIGDRLEQQNPEIRFSNSEIYSMQEMCGFETTVRGGSPWCDVFTRKDWLHFEYARDVIHYFRTGPGNPYGPVMGWLWLNATTNLLSVGPLVGPLFFSFVHDGDIIPMLAALDLFHDAFKLPVTHVAKSRQWRTSQITPMGGRIIFERLKCPYRSKSDNEDGDIFVRINVNDGIVAIPSCKAGPGESCLMSEFVKLVQRRGNELGDFRRICGLGKDAPGRITFLHQ